MNRTDRKADRRRIEAARQRGDSLAAVLASRNPMMAHFAKLGAAYSVGRREEGS